MMRARYRCSYTQWWSQGFWGLQPPPYPMQPTKPPKAILQSTTMNQEEEEKNKLEEEKVTGK